MSEIATILQSLLLVFIIASATRFLTQRMTTIPYTVVLVLVGLGIAILDFDLLIELSPGIILFIFHPPILFQGAAEIDFPAFRENLPVVLSIVLVRLPFTLLLFGLLGMYVLELPFFITVLFATMIYSTDPVAVLELFEDMNVPERLSVLLESESLLSDGLVIILFTILISTPQDLSAASPEDALLTPDFLIDVTRQLAIDSIGGIFIGVTIGYLAYRIIRRINDRMNAFLLTAVVAYGSFLVADHFIAVNGILATVAGGLLLGTTGREYALRSDTAEFCRNTWEAIVFMVNTVLFLLIGTEVSVGRFLQEFELIILAAALVMIVRGGTIYFTTFIANRFVSRPVPLNYQHILTWSGMHAVIPVALALSLPPEIPFRDRLRTLVFGIVILSITVHGILLPYLLEATGVIESETSEA